MNSLTDVISQKSILINARAIDWKDAIRLAGQLLVDEGAVTENYVNRMIEMVEEVGPYILVAPGLAMPHARPKDGAKKVAISIVKLANTVVFPDKEDEPVSCVMALAAVDQNTHLEVLAHLAKLLGDDDFVPKIENMNSVQEIIQFIKDKCDLCENQ